LSTEERILLNRFSIVFGPFEELMKWQQQRFKFLRKSASEIFGLLLTLNFSILRIIIKHLIANNENTQNGLFHLILIFVAFD
jgi:hypothetical protein